MATIEKSGNMDYKEKYEKAIVHLKKFLNGDCVVDQEILADFPELAESEDERIRKRLIEYFEGFKMGNAEARWEGLIVQEVLAWLEKQKENPKNADSIPSDCTSDAKCEDRWYKVGDSLPDNPREVLCKDEAGNYFIGRYYVGEGWEISNYDDEDKPHHLNPPVSKWIDFPLEKQKEQKHPNGCFTCDEYKKGYEAGRSNGFTAGYNKAMKEQKPAEWSEEDVDMLNSCISSIEEAKENRYAYKETDGDTSYDHEIAWLKSLRPRLYWEPSEYQIQLLLSVINDPNNAASASAHLALKSLYNDLKKL